MLTAYKGENPRFLSCFYQWRFVSITFYPWKGCFYHFYRFGLCFYQFLSVSPVLGDVSICFYSFYQFLSFLSFLSIFANFKIIVTNTWRVESNKEPGFFVETLEKQP
jgi:hypothetical protein